MAIHPPCLALLDVSLQGGQSCTLPLFRRGAARDGLLAEAHLDMHALKSVLGVKR